MTQRHEGPFSLDGTHIHYVYSRPVDRLWPELGCGTTRCGVDPGLPQYRSHTGGNRANPARQPLPGGQTNNNRSDSLAGPAGHQPIREQVISGVVGKPGGSEQAGFGG